MLLECPSTAVVRHKYFSSTTLKELFSNVDARQYHYKDMTGVRKFKNGSTNFNKAIQKY